MKVGYFQVFPGKFVKTESKTKADKSKGSVEKTKQDKSASRERKVNHEPKLEL